MHVCFTISCYNPENEVSPRTENTEICLIQAYPTASLEHFCQILLRLQFRNVNLDTVIRHNYYNSHSNPHHLPDCTSSFRDPDVYRLYSLAGIRTEPTCVPTSLLPTVLMFIGEDQDIVVQLVENIMVGGCGCV